jgi:argininosuccinate synthase
LTKKVVLAFSGGLDTSFCTSILKDEGYDVITVFVDTGGFDKKNLKKIKERALYLGASRHYIISAAKDLYEKIIGFLIRTNGMYQNIYPQMCADRYIIVEKCIEVAKKENAKIIAHGCTAMGNDQVRFDVSIRALSEYEIMAPIRDLQKKIKKGIRQYEIDYLRKKRFEVPVAHRRYSINQNILGVTISGSEIDVGNEPSESAFVLTKPIHKTPTRPLYIKIGFNRGLPVSVNKRKQEGIYILKRLNQILGNHGCGRFIYTGDCIIGIKGRIAFECPGLYALITAHKALEETVLSKEQNQFKETISQRWAYLVYSGLYFDPLREDIEKFIDSHQRYVTGEVVLKVHKGSMLPVKCSSDYLLKEKGTVYAQSSTWHSGEAEGFTKLFGMSTILAKRRP